LQVEARGARLFLRCPSVYGGGVVDLGQPGSRQGQGEVQMMCRSFVKQRKSRGRDRLGDGNLYLPDYDLPEALSAPVMDSLRP
jgi:hypothetical protein